MEMGTNLAPPPPVREPLTMNGTVVVDESGQPYDPVEAAAQLPWRSALVGDGMPAHQYVVFATREPKGLSPGMDEPAARLAVNVLLTAIEHHPDAYDAYLLNRAGLRRVGDTSGGD